MNFNSTFDFSSVDAELVNEFFSQLADRYDELAKILASPAGWELPALPGDIKAALLKDNLLSGGQYQDLTVLYFQESFPDYSILGTTDPILDQDIFAFLNFKYWEGRSSKFGPSFKLVFTLLAPDLPALVSRVFVTSRTDYKSDLMKLPLLSVCRLKIHRTAKGYPSIGLVDQPALISRYLQSLKFETIMSDSTDQAPTPFSFAFDQMRETVMPVYQF